MLIVTDQHDAVARGDPQDREKPDQRAEREDAVAREIRRQHAAHQGQGQAQEGQHRQAPVPEGRLQEEEDHEHRDKPGEQDALLGSLPLGVLAEQLRVIAQRELDFLERLFDIGHDGAEIASFHFGVNVNAPRQAFTIDGVRSRHDAHIGHIRQPHLLAAGRVDQQVREYRSGCRVFRACSTRSHRRSVAGVKVADFFACHQDRPPPGGHRRV